MTEAEAIARLAQKGVHIVESSDGRKVLAVPDNYKHFDITDPNGLKPSLPRYISQAVSLQTTDSLVDYVTAFKYDATRIFADIGSSTIAAAIDYHNHSGEAAHVAHRATLTLAHSIEWVEWNKVSGKLDGQLEFARFIEENAADVRAPSAAELLEVARDLQAHRKVNFTKAVRTSSDNESFEYSEEFKATTRNGGIEIPTQFKLGLPVYFNEPETELLAFLRWRLNDGGLTLGIVLHRAEHVRQAVFKQIVLAVAERTGCPAVFGKI